MLGKRAWNMSEEEWSEEQNLSGSASMKVDELLELNESRTATEESVKSFSVFWSRRV